jgi:hypothetical protein
VAGPSRPLTLANGGWRLEPLPASAGSWLARYRTPAFLLTGALVLALLWLLYPRVVRRELDPAG